MDDSDERRRQRERLVAYFIGGLVREHGVNVSDQPAAMQRLRHFAEVGQEGLEENRLDALTVNDASIAIGLAGPIAFRVSIDKTLLRAILDGLVPAPVDDAACAAAREQRAQELRRAAEDARKPNKEVDEQWRGAAESEARATRRIWRMLWLSLVAFVAFIIAIIAIASSGHGRHEKKSEGSHTAR